ADPAAARRSAVARARRAADRSARRVRAVRGRAAHVDRGRSDRRRARGHGAHAAVPREAQAARAARGGRVVKLVDAIREVDDDPELAAATRTRIRRSLEGRARTRHRAVRAGAVTLVLFVSTMSWALSTGRIPLFVERAPAPVIDTAPLELPAPQVEHA